MTLLHRCLEQRILVSDEAHQVRNTLTFSFINTEEASLCSEDANNTNAALPAIINISVWYGKGDNALVDSLDQAIAIAITAGADWHFAPFIPDLLIANKAVASLTYTGKWSFDALKRLTFKLKNILSYNEAGIATIDMTFHRFFPDGDRHYHFTVERCVSLPPYLQFYPDFSCSRGASNSPGKAVDLYYKITGTNVPSDKIAITPIPDGPALKIKNNHASAIVSNIQTKYQLTVGTIPLLSTSLFVYPAEPEAEFSENIDEHGKHILRCNVLYADSTQTLFVHTTDKGVIRYEGADIQVMDSRYALHLDNNSHNFVTLVCLNAMGTLIQTVWCPPATLEPCWQKLHAFCRTVRRRKGAWFIRLDWAVNGGMAADEALYFLNPQLRTENMFATRSQDIRDSLIWFDVHRHSKAYTDKTYTERKHYRWEYAFPLESTDYFQGIASYYKKDKGTSVRLQMPEIFCGQPEWYFLYGKQGNAPC